jgi:hypothetical protein
MKLSLSIAALALFVNTSAFAAWTPQTTILNVQNISDPDQISDTLAFSHQTQDKMVSLELSHPSKLTIKSISMNVVEYQWANDADCQASQPATVPNQRVETASVDYFYAAAPTDLKHLGLGDSLPLSPCESSR